jgi:hypothetical protein
MKLTMLRIRVIKNRVEPTAKIVLYVSEPVGVSPEATCTMKAVIVWQD